MLHSISDTYHILNDETTGKLTEDFLPLRRFGSVAYCCGECTTNIKDVWINYHGTIRGILTI